MTFSKIFAILIWFDPPTMTTTAVVDNYYTNECVWDPSINLFRLTRIKGNTIASGGYGCLIHRATTTSTAGSLRNNRKRKLLPNGTSRVGLDGNLPVNLSSSLEVTSQPDEASETIQNAPIQEFPAISLAHDSGRDDTITKETPKQQSKPDHFLFIEDVLVLYERGLLDCFRHDHDAAFSTAEQAAENGSASLVSRPRAKYSRSELYWKLLNEPAGASCRQEKGVQNGSSHDEMSIGEMSSFTIPPQKLFFSVYLVYAHLRQQSYRVVRHTPHRHGKLVAMAKQEQILEKLCDDQAATTTNETGDVEPCTDGVDAVCDDEDEANGKVDLSIDVEENMKQKQLLLPSELQRQKMQLQKLRRDLRDDAAQALPPTIFTTTEAVSENDTPFAWDVYRPNSQYSKANPGLPNFRVMVAPFTGNGVSVDWLHQATSTESDQEAIPAKIAVVSDAGTVLMFGLSTASVPPNLHQYQSSKPG
jgi:hypothetical protein